MVQLYRVFAYLKKYHKSELGLDPSDQVIDRDEFEHQDWTSHEFGHVSGKYYLAPNMPDPHGLVFAVMARVDIDHAGDTVK